MAKAIFDTAWLPSLAAIRALAPARQAGHAATEAQVLVDHILSRLAAEHPGGVVPAAEAEELREMVARVVELVSPLDVADPDVRRQNAERHGWVERAFELACGHLSL